MPSPISRPGAALACFGGQCHSFAEARTLVANANGDWQSLLPQVTVRSVNGPTSSHSSNENCEFCNGSIAGPTEVPAERLAEFYKYSRKHPLEAWNVGCATGNIQKLKARLIGFRQDDTLLTGRCKAKTLRSGRTLPPKGDCKPGFVPVLLENQTLDIGRGWRSFHLKNGVPFFMPCSSARGEDAAVLRSFFTDRQTGQPIREGTFLEIGGVDGLRESNTWVFELCLGWRGVRARGDRIGPLNNRHVSASHAHTRVALPLAGDRRGPSILFRAAEDESEGEPQPPNGGMRSASMGQLHPRTIHCREHQGPRRGCGGAPGPLGRHIARRMRAARSEPLRA